MQCPWPASDSVSQASTPLTPWEELESCSPEAEIVLQVGIIHCTVRVPRGMDRRGQELIEQFVPTASTLEPSSALELCCLFMHYMMHEIMQDGGGDLDMAILHHVLNTVHVDLLQNENIHTVLSAMSQDKSRHQSILQAYFQACKATRSPGSAGTSRLLSAVDKGHARIFALFNGQGVESYFDELLAAYDIYHPQVASIIRAVSESLTHLAHDDRFEALFPHGLDVDQWLRMPESRPDAPYLTSAPVSFPLVGLSQFVQYAIACINLGLSPGELRHVFRGAIGHSQGIVVAAFVAAANSWDSLCNAAQQAVELLFWIGCRCQQQLQDVGPASVLSSCMLSVKGLSQADLQRHLDELNLHLPAEEAVYLALVNGPEQLVVAGLPLSLRALDQKIGQGQNKAQSTKTSTGRIPFSQRRPVVHTRFLSITAPFHSPYLQDAETQLMRDLADVSLADVSLSGSRLAFPVFHTETAQNLQESGNIVPHLINMICTRRVQFENVVGTTLAGVTHVLDFGPGGEVGIGSLVNHQREGTGLRTLILGATRGVISSHNSMLGSESELYTHNGPVLCNTAWDAEFTPRLMQSPCESRHLVDTKFSRLLGVPPVMVAGMTPTTTASEFVAATMNAGYHVELACGGFPDRNSMREGILATAAAIAPGRGITCNVIYANPRAMAWQIPLLIELSKSGIPITGLTIGAGIPSLEIVRGYLTDLSLTHLALKPGSKEGIDGVLAIARANPTYPIILQWTGGRGGGHHSSEDFHEPLLDRYAQIRSHHNVILVVGSGFGNAEQTYPYLTGSWSHQFGRAPMPVDGILLGSRVMAAKEAHTSEDVKKAICDTPGVGNENWELTYERPAGGIISVRSEMGEPIHKLATRGVMLWAELDKSVFSLPRGEQKAALLARKTYFLKRLNEDFQKVWFGRDVHGATVDLHEMTYAEVWDRMIDLLYLKVSQEWIDPSWQALVWDYTRRLEERLGKNQHTLLQRTDQLDQPDQFRDMLFSQYPQAHVDVLTAADVEYIHLISRRRGQKPVPFLTVLDEDFEYWFKKDSLWQSERLEAVVGQDVGRVCILHGPVAAQYTKTVDEPVQSILDGIHNTYVAWILRDQYVGDLAQIPSAARQRRAHPHWPVMGVHLAPQQDGKTARYIVSENPEDLPLPEVWLGLLADTTAAPWCHAVLTEKNIVQDRVVASNPIMRLFAAKPGLVAEVWNPQAPNETEIILKEIEKNGRDGEQVLAVASLRCSPEGQITLTLSDQTVVGRAPADLVFRFQFQPRDGAPSIHEVMPDRNQGIKQFYRSIWIGEHNLLSTPDFVFRGENIVLDREVIRRFARSVSNRNPVYYNSRSQALLVAPLDLAIAVAWKPIMSCLFPDVVSGDMLRLLHLSNEFQLCDGATPLQEGDHLSSDGRLTAVTIKKGSGKVIEAEGTIYRQGMPVVRLKSKFILLGSYDDYESTFETKEEKWRLPLATKKDAALLRSRMWFRPEGKIDLLDHLHHMVEVQTTSRTWFMDADSIPKLKVEGQVVWQSDSGSELVVLGSICFSNAAPSARNPVTEYLQRHGSLSTGDNCIFDVPRPLVQDLTVTVPDAGREYARESGDCNPIHLSGLFARYAGHDTRVTHGMFTSGYVRGLVASHLARSDETRVRSWLCTFDDKVCAGDQLAIQINHVGMSGGKMLVAVQVHNVLTGVKVLSGQASIAQPTTAYVFTGQGSQQPGMGMALYESSPAAQQIWKAADEFFENTYGFSITNIVRSNPKELTVHFGGARGRAIRKNYMSLTFDAVDDNGKTNCKPIFPNINRTSRSHRFRSVDGLLHETQFTQPALALMEIARFEDMRSRGVVEDASLFAGHSLGEYVALTAMGRIFSVQKVAGLVFYRGLSMQNAVQQDSDGATQYSMCAVNPTRVSKGFSQDDLSWCVAEIARQTKGLLEIVNYNVLSLQYVCAGDLRGLATLTDLMNALASRSLGTLSKPGMQRFIQDSLTALDGCTGPVVLKRGRATIPLKVNVPFHSSLLRPGVQSFRQFLSRNLAESSIQPEQLVGKYIPNLTARPFELSKAYVEGVLALTESPVLEHLLCNWESMETGGYDERDLFPW
ncbi:Fatty acid synthase subunit beta [Penicillium samsonianum]|uniref:Fatty acid synthase subunit beta n=1 Tax=Penicillium samsonianum TaxID=1882272 RepID=UPI00254789D6|nr:Fatty acid synthase subunit beta [Penicillium samsonianum]KAJ6125114.1 Fatty acid synthase subunit beta [Penicillium samsonianum]